MRIKLDENEKYKNNLEVEIHYFKQIEEIKQLTQHIELFDLSIPCWLEKERKIIQVKEIFYFESVDNKTFVYCEDVVLVSELKLYELEEKLKSSNFCRISKSMILNVDTIDKINTLLNSRLQATLENQEKVMISRQYAPMLKKKIGL